MEQGVIRAPEFPDGMEWFNTGRPLKLAGLRGKIVILDFWTACCVNCLHVLADLRRLEERYPREFVVIGVHSAKFTAERDGEYIRRAILRLGIGHPVVNDRDLAVWDAYTVHAWPTLVLVDPTGRIVGALSGEGIYDTFDRLIGEIIAALDPKGLIDRSPLTLRPEREGVPDSPLSFPGKVHAHEPSGRLFIADTNHHRIVVAGLLDGRIREVIGSGREGFADGTFAEAAFSQPQGMTSDGRYLTIADAGNHAIRRVDLDAKTIVTIAGTGKQARDFNRYGEAAKTPQNSPSDLVLHEGTLYIAMAGAHQLWRMDLETGQIRPHAGTVREGRLDGPLMRADFAQPSGLATDGRLLYVADSENSAIRAAAIDPKGEVETLAGGELFDFGDADGIGLAARFQHPLGVACHEGMLYIADTYNNKIRRLDPADRSVNTFAGTGEAGLVDGAGAEARFNGPSGVAAAGGILFIADTDNHAIRRIDLATGRTETVTLT
ncbi:MAG: thioredoxin-like domain-containing protein [Syntrophales bacterium]